MRNESEIRSGLLAARKAYREADETQPRSVAYPLSLKVKELMAELSKAIAEGAKPCDKCGTAPHGMRFQNYVKDGVEVSLYEVGCLKCSDRRSRGTSGKAAVESWNAAKYYAREAKK